MEELGTAAARLRGLEATEALEAVEGLQIILLSFDVSLQLPVSREECRHREINRLWVFIAFTVGDNKSRFAATNGASYRPNVREATAFAV